jgi:hypothetical protein
MANVHKFGWHRREYVANSADPTWVTIWTFKFWVIQLKLTAIWGIESKLYVGRFRFEGYDSWWAVRLFEWLEDGLVTEEYDPEVLAAERRAGWDPNP